jgi:predicted NBD/HSP70 family sugar kinase
MIFLFDVGGTRTRCALSRDGMTFSSPVVFDTPQEPARAVELLLKSAERLTGGKPPEVACGGVPGMLSKGRETLTRAPHLPQWEGVPLKEMLKDALKTEFFLQNDAALVGLGEATRGAGRDFRIVEYLTISTGVGGVRVVEGSIDDASVSFEPGHQIIDVDRTVFPNTEGTLESYVSGTAVSKRTGKHPKEITDAVFWDDIAHYLAYGVYNTILHWSPDVVLLGGSMVVRTPGISVSDVTRHLSTIASRYTTLPPLRKAELGDFGGLYGALTYVTQKSPSGEKVLE